MRLPIVLLLALLLAACNPRGAGNHENVGGNVEGLKLYADNNYDLSVTWPVMFSVLVDGEKDAKGLAEALLAKGYLVETGPENGGIWYVLGVKQFVPTAAAIDAAEKEVVVLSDQFDGYYEGWELAEGEEEAAAEPTE
jgi:hypothetical protein